MKAKTLIVDDDPLIIKLLEKKLSRAGFTTDSVQDGQQALEKVHRFKPDIIISDIMMPNIDGYELHQTLRQNPETASIPFIFLSAKASPVEQLEGLRMGADEYLCKPVDFDNLIERIQSVMSRASIINPHDVPPDFSGNFSRISLVDICQLIETNQKTGELVFKKKSWKTAGKAFFTNGKLIHAETDKLSGEEAFFDLMEDIDNGFFEFFSKPVTVSETIVDPTMSVLLNGTRLLDEAGGLSAAVTSPGCRLRVVSRDISPALENKIKKENIDHILQLVDKSVSCAGILESEFMSRPRAASALVQLLKEGIVEAQHISESPRFQMDSNLLEKIHDIYTRELNGVLEMAKDSSTASIYFKRGELIHAVFGMASGKKALFRILYEKGWDSCFLDQNVSVAKSIQSPLDKLLIDAAREIDKLLLFDENFFNQEVSVQAELRQQEALADNRDDLQEIFNLAKTHKQVRNILDHSRFTDLSTLKILLDLINYNILTLYKN